MSYEVLELNSARRAADKQASRDNDARLLAAGILSKDQLKRKNSFLGALPMSQFKMVAIGGKPISRQSR